MGGESTNFGVPRVGHSHLLDHTDRLIHCLARGSVGKYSVRNLDAHKLHSACIAVWLGMGQCESFFEQDQWRRCGRYSLKIKSFEYRVAFLKKKKKKKKNFKICFFFLKKKKKKKKK